MKHDVKRNKCTGGVNCMDAALNIITYKDRTGYELEKKLKEKGYTEDEIAAVTEKLAEYRYIDDERYALRYAKDRSLNRGTRVIRMELKNKGVDDVFIARAMDELDTDEVDTVLSLLNRRYPEADLSDEKTRNRIYGFLLRRGFSYETISKALSVFACNSQHN